MLLLTWNLDFIVLAQSQQTGKTFLTKMIKSIAGEDKIAITYNDLRLGVDLGKLITSKSQLLVLDSFDMYDEEANKLQTLKQTDCITLVDYKTQRNFVILMTLVL